MRLPDDLSANKYIRILLICAQIFPRTEDNAIKIDIRYLEDDHFYYLVCDFVKEMTDDLPEREQEIVAMRWGIGQFDRILTLEEVAEKMSVTRERVRQVEQKAWVRFRHPHYALSLQALLDNRYPNISDGDFL